MKVILIAVTPTSTSTGCIKAMNTHHLFVLLVSIKRIIMRSFLVMIVALFYQKTYTLPSFRIVVVQAFPIRTLLVMRSIRPAAPKHKLLARFDLHLRMQDDNDIDEDTDTSTSSDKVYKDDDDSPIRSNQRVVLSRPERKALERMKKVLHQQQQQQTQRYPTMGSKISSTYTLLPIKPIPVQNNHNNNTSTAHSSTSEKILRRSIQQIQMTRNSYQLHQLVKSRHLNSSSSYSNRCDENLAQHFSNQSSITTPNNINISSSLLMRLIVATIYCSDYDLLEDTLIPLWKQQSWSNNDGNSYKDAATIIRSVLYTAPSPTAFTKGKLCTSRGHLSVVQAWEILETLNLNDCTSTNTGINDNHTAMSSIDDSKKTDSELLYYYRAKSLIYIATWYFMQNEPLLAIQTCAVVYQTGSFLQKNEGLSNSSGHDLLQQLPWIRLFQEASACQSRLRQNNCTSLIRTSDTNVEGKNVTSLYDLLKRTSSTGLELPSSLPSNVVYTVLSAMSTFPKKYAYVCDRIYELISNALVRRIVFVTGAVSMAGCPKSNGQNEVCFIGRSNVGKSSLINMIFNRKALAYTSKRPGKTQQFNFFTVNDIPDKEKEIKYGDDIAGMYGKTKDDDSFYIVDLPGFGYAKVPIEQKQKWMMFMDEYFTNRANLRIIFHLIDSRHGPMNDDRIIMKQIAATLKKRDDTVRYVIVLTKADKNTRGNNSNTPQNDNNNRQQSQLQMRNILNSGGKVSKNIQTAVVNAMEECGINRRTTPIVLTSAETKLGRDDIWRYLQVATEHKDFFVKESLK